MGQALNRANTKRTSRSTTPHLPSHSNSHCDLLCVAYWMLQHLCPTQRWATAAKGLECRIGGKLNPGPSGLCFPSKSGYVPLTRASPGLRTMVLVFSYPYPWPLAQRSFAVPLFLLCSSYPTLLDPPESPLRLLHSCTWMQPCLAVRPSAHQVSCSGFFLSCASVNSHLPSRYLGVLRPSSRHCSIALGTSHTN